MVMKVFHPMGKQGTMAEYVKLHSPVPPWPPMRSDRAKTQQEGPARCGEKTTSIIEELGCTPSLPYHSAKQSSSVIKTKVIQGKEISPPGIAGAIFHWPQGTTGLATNFVRVFL